MASSANQLGEALAGLGPNDLASRLTKGSLFRIELIVDDPSMEAKYSVELAQKAIALASVRLAHRNRIINKFEAGSKLLALALRGCESATLGLNDPRLDSMFNGALINPLVDVLPAAVALNDSRQARVEANNTLTTTCPPLHGLFEAIKNESYSVAGYEGFPTTPTTEQGMDMSAFMMGSLPLVLAAAMSADALPTPSARRR